MNQSLSNQIKNLKSALLSLNATGTNGFEGLIASALHEITGVPFRLASSGLQFGIDGKSSYDSDSICFEGKRYDGNIPRYEVITKIADLARNNNHPDLVWVLGATSPVKTQLANDVRADGRNSGISILILDWSTADLPPLAAALAMGGRRVEEFLKENISDNNDLQNALFALDAVKSNRDFNEHAKRIKAELDAPAIGTALAKEANAGWLTDGFSNRKHARIRFGQPLSPGDGASTKLLHRKTLTDQLQPLLESPPDEKVVFVLGGEGFGKSWIIAQSWLTLSSKPLMIIFNPDEFEERAEQNNIDELLIAKLIKQTGDEPTEINRQRWHRRLQHWQKYPDTGSPRLVIIIDGINQKPNIDWGRIIDKTGALLEQMRGRLFVTARTPYFRERIKNRLTVQAIEIHIPEWNPAERNEILRNYGINSAELHPAVAQSLLNPRLLGIAVELLDKDDVIALEELSVSRLLFEHIRASELDAPTPQLVDAFVRQLQEHAQKILSRVEEKQEDDLNIFEADTLAVADGRFFHPVEGEPGRYQLKNDGLTLALGFSVVDRLRRAKRNRRNLEESLTVLLEPIAALDSTADVILAALTVTVVDDDRYMPDIAIALVKGFANLQNPDQTKFPAFVGLSKSKPLVFMDAAHDLCINDTYQQNFDWIKFALIEASKNTRIWPEIANEIRRWLSMYSLSPGRIESQQAIDETLNALSSYERKILEGLRQQDSDLYALTRLGLYMLAGKPLSPFAECLVNWRFSIALNSNYTAPHKDLTHLIGLNRMDWRETRTALLKACKPLRGNNVSRTGKWALVAILRATGDIRDDEEAQSLATELMKDRPRFKNWKLIEDYCATDPCDPDSTEPDNICQTAERYEAIDVSKLRLVRGQTSEDLFFVDARLGMARFRSVKAVAKHRELAENILAREGGFPLRQGLFELHKHNVLLTTAQTQALISRWREVKSDDTLNGLTKQDSQIVSQYHLLLAFPLLSANEQTEILLSIKEDEPILLDLFKSMSSLDESSFEQLLAKARKNQDEYKQYLLLMMAKSTRTPLSVEVSSFITSLINSDSKRLREQALEIIADTNDNNMLTAVAQSGWSAASLDTENRLEEWYSSVALIKAAANGLIDHQEVLDRVSPRLYGYSATLLNINAKREIAQRINESIKQMREFGNDLVGPDIELKIRSDAPYEPNRFNSNETESQTQDIPETIQLFSDPARDFKDRRKRNHDAFIAFKNTLTKAKAYIILDGLRLHEFTAIVSENEDIAEEWYSLFVRLPPPVSSVSHKLILLLAHALSSTQPEKAKALFMKIINNKPTFRFTFGLADIELDTMATWASGKSAVLSEQCFIRLDQAETDHDLFLEVLAGLINGKQDVLEQYVNKKLAREEPAEIARGIMVVGFSDVSSLNSEILSRYENSAGLIGSAYKAAKYAYERNCWARHWFQKMCETTEPDTFWSNAVLFNKIVDGRFDVWCADYPQEGHLIATYGLNISEKLKDRYESWKKHREKKLFDNEAPDRIFLHGTEYNS